MFLIGKRIWNKNRELLLLLCLDTDQQTPPPPPPSPKVGHVWIPNSAGFKEGEWRREAQLTSYSCCLPQSSAEWLTHASLSYPHWFFRSSWSLSPGTVPPPGSVVLFGFSPVAKNWGVKGMRNWAKRLLVGYFPLVRSSPSLLAFKTWFEVSIFYVFCRED